MNYNNSFFNPDDKRKTRRQILTKFCSEHIPKQKQIIKYYKTKPNQYLIHDKYGNYKLVSKYYYFYKMEEEEYDTETEPYDEEWSKEVERIQNKYNNKNNLNI
jgi:hypothetical protein